MLSEKKNFESTDLIVPVKITLPVELGFALKFKNMQMFVVLSLLSGCNAWTS